MPASPTPAPVRRLAPNGARSHGPATPEGKARSALNGTRHGLRGATFSLLPDEDPAEWAALLAGYLARFRPADAAELACVERLAACDWREARLLRLETETLFAGRGDTSEPDPRLGWSRTLPRYAAAIRRDRKEALDQLEMLRASRPRLPRRPTAADAARFRWLASATERQPAGRKPRPPTTRPNPSRSCGTRARAPAAAPVPPAPTAVSRPNPGGRSRPGPTAPSAGGWQRSAAAPRKAGPPAGPGSGTRGDRPHTITRGTLVAWSRS